MSFTAISIIIVALFVLHPVAVDLGAVGDKIAKTLHVLEEAKKVIYKATGDSGSVEIQGRTLHYQVKGGSYKWKYQYTGKAWDFAAQITVKSKGWKSAGGAREHVLEDLVAELRKKGFLT